MIYTSKHMIVCTYLSHHHPLFQFHFCQFSLSPNFPSLHLSVSLSPLLSLSLYFSLSHAYITCGVHLYCSFVHVFRHEKEGLENLCESSSLKETILLLSAALTICRSSCRSRTMWILPHQGCPDEECYHDVGFIQETIFLRFIRAFPL